MSNIEERETLNKKIEPPRLNPHCFFLTEISRGKQRREGRKVFVREKQVEPPRREGRKGL